MLRFDLKEWPQGESLDKHSRIHPRSGIVAVPHKGKIFAFGVIDAVKEAFGSNLKGAIERAPVGPKGPYL